MAPFPEVTARILYAGTNVLWPPTGLNQTVTSRDRRYAIICQAAMVEPPPEAVAGGVSAACVNHDHGRSRHGQNSMLRRGQAIAPKTSGRTSFPYR